MSGIGIICFAASYAIVLAIEISRLAFRSGIRGAMLVGWAVAGMIAHTAFLYYQAVQAEGPPLSSWQDWFLVAAWLLMLVYFYLLFYHPRTSFGIFLLPLVLGLIAVGRFAASPQPFARAPASQAWGALHAISLALASVSLLVGLATGLMYLHQDRHLKRKIAADRGLRLPSLEWLQAAARRSQVIAALMFGVGIAAGMILNAVRHGPGATRMPWNDPIIVCTVAMFLWLLVFLGVSLLDRSLRQGRKAALLAILNFLLFVAALAAGLTLGTRHGGGEKDGKLSIANCKLQIEQGLVRPSSFIIHHSSFFLQPTEAQSHVSASRRL
jgi:ABC-type transport system involved in cytochrome c biogenesis permease subunit